MEIEVGEYIRLKNGYIVGKVIEIVPESGDETGFCDEYVKTEKLNTVFYNEIANHSKNTIDLIEEGDILEIKEGNDICYLGLEKNTTTVNYADIIEDIKAKKCKLLSILTKEQYSQNCYRLEE